MRLLRRGIGLLSLVLVSGAAGAAWSQRDSGQRLFGAVQRLVETRYIDELGTDDVYRLAAEGLIQELGDPYSEVYEPEERSSFTTSHMGRYGGVGMEVESVHGTSVVNQVFPGTPAERAGLRAGDRILWVGEDDVRDLPLPQVTSRLRGEPGTDVDVRVARPGTGVPLRFSITREEIHVPSVPFTLLLEGQVGYVPLVRFWEGSSQGVATAVEKLRAEGATSIVLDLRGNGGGLMDEAVELASLFLEPGAVVVEQRERDRITRLSGQGPTLSLDLPLAVLVDEGSASASEIVAGALQDYRRAVIIGEPTFGKGVVQSAYQLDGGYVLKLTTGSWHTPLGRSLDRTRRATMDILASDDVDAASSDGVPAPGSASASAGGDPAGATVDAAGATEAGIVPDAVVAADTLSTVDRAFVDAVTPHSQAYLTAINDLGEELKGDVARGFEVPAAWRDLLFERLAEAGVDVPRSTFDEARGFVDRALGTEVAREAFGNAGAKEWAADRDRALGAAVRLLAGKATQRQVFAELPERRP